MSRCLKWWHTVHTKRIRRRKTLAHASSWIAMLCRKHEGAECSGTAIARAGVFGAVGGGGIVLSLWRGHAKAQAQALDAEGCGVSWMRCVAESVASDF